MTDKPLLEACGGPFAVVPAHIFETPGTKRPTGLSRGATWLFVVLCRHANKSGYCWRSNRKLAEQAGVTTRTIQRWRLELERRGLLVVKYRPDECNLYRVIRHPAKRLSTAMNDAVKSMKAREQFAEAGRQGAARRAEVRAEMVEQKKPSQPVGGDIDDTGGVTQMTPKYDPHEYDQKKQANPVESSDNATEAIPEPSEQTSLLLPIDGGKKEPPRRKPKRTTPTEPSAWQQVERASNGRASWSEVIGAAQRRWFNELMQRDPEGNIFASMDEETQSMVTKAEARERGAGLRTINDWWRAQEAAKALNGEVLPPEAVDNRKECSGGWTCVDGCRCDHQEEHAGSWAAA